MIEPNNPIRCLVLDDEFPATTLLNSYINKHPSLQLIDSTTHVIKALTILKQGQIELLFLDIEMPELNGIELLKTISGKKIQVILTTAFKEYALDGYEYNVVDYLLKPITYARFELAIQKAKEKLRVSGGADCIGEIYVKVNYQLRKVPFAEILFLESLGDYIAFHTTSGKLVTLDTLKQLQQQLPEQCFLRIHRSYIVQKKFISGMDAASIIIGDINLPIGLTYRESVRKFLRP